MFGSILISQISYSDIAMSVQDCSILAFILDNLLPQCQDAGDSDSPALSRVLLASIAACNHSPDAQATLAAEIKLALQRALLLSESTEKHSKIVALCGIISTVIEACPSPGHIQNQVFKNQQSLINNMVRILLKKNLVSDLARIPHSLDLSSPSMANTINAALKPLETLSRIVNQPQTLASRITKQRSSLHDANADNAAFSEAPEARTEDNGRLLYFYNKLLSQSDVLHVLKMYLCN